MPLIAWRLRNLAEPSSRVLMKGLHSCTNCHSVSRDGKTMGLDVDGPRNNKGLYALFPIQPEAAIRKENVIEWSTFRGKLGGKLRVAFMSQVSPDGRYVVTMISDPGRGQTDYQRRQSPDDLRQNYYVANFTDYRFLQVFYPTRGILAWYSKATGMLKPLPGADDPDYVHTGATWSPDGKYLVFARAKARDVVSAGGHAGHLRQRSERDADPVRPLPHPVQRRPGGHAHADRGRLGQRHEQQLPEDLARRTLDRLRAGAQWTADAS